MNFYNEMIDANGGVRAHYRAYDEWLKATPPNALPASGPRPTWPFIGSASPLPSMARKKGKERLIPFDIIPRVIPAAEWKAMQSGLRQRVKALNMFLHDVYHDQEILKAGKIPAEQVLNNTQYRPVMQGVGDLPGQIYAHITGVV